MRKLETFCCLFGALEATCATKVGTDCTVLSLIYCLASAKKEFSAWLMEGVDKAIMTVHCWLLCPNERTNNHWGHVPLVRVTYTRGVFWCWLVGRTVAQQVSFLSDFKLKCVSVCRTSSLSLYWTSTCPWRTLLGPRLLTLRLPSTVLTACLAWPWLWAGRTGTASRTPMRHWLQMYR